MAQTGMTRKQTNRAIRQDELRRYLEERGKVSYILDIVEKLENPSADIDKPMVDRLKIAVDARMRLLNKYLPDTKAVEVTGEGGGPVEHDHFHQLDLEAALAVLNEHGVDTGSL